MLDRLFTIHILSWIFRLFQQRRQEAIPKLMRQTTMGVDPIFR